MLENKINDDDATQETIDLVRRKITGISLSQENPDFFNPDMKYINVVLQDSIYKDAFQPIYEAFQQGLIPEKEFLDYQLNAFYENNLKYK